jgi:hypothetical protein
VAIERRHRVIIAALMSFLLKAKRNAMKLRSLRNFVQLAFARRFKF